MTEPKEKADKKAYLKYLKENTKIVASWPRWIVDGAHGISILDKKKKNERN